jgi:membrane protein
LSDPDQIKHVLEPTGVEIKTAAGGARRYRKPLKCFRWPDIQYLLTDSLEGWSKHKAPRLGAALAFYTLLSLAPLLLVVVAVVGLVFGHTAAQREIVGQVQMLVGPAGAKTADALLQASQHRTQGALATLLGLLTLLFSASGVMIELRDALNTIWEIPTPAVAGVKSKVAVYLRDRLLSFAMVLSVGFLLVVSLAISSWVAALGAFSASVLPSTEVLLHLTNSIVSFIVITGLFAAIYKIMPDVRLEWRDVILGGAVTSLLFTLGKLILALYLGKASFASSYGAFASLVVLVIWVYYSGQIFFFGAEFTRSFANCYGSQPEERSERLVILAEEATKPTTAEPPRIIFPS